MFRRLFVVGVVAALLAGIPSIASAIGPPPVTFPPDAFDKVAPVDASASVPLNVTLSWEASGLADSYEYCYDTVPGTTCEGAWTSTDTTSVGLSSLSAATTYYWQVRAQNVDGTTYANGGDWWSFITVVGPPGSFGKTYPYSSAHIGVNTTLEWQTSRGAASYQYCYDTTPGATCEGTWFGVGGTWVLLSPLAPGTTYYWQVRAQNPGGTTYANGGDWWSFTTISLPSSFGKSAPTDGASSVSLNPTLSWGASSGGSSLYYWYCYDTTPGATCDGTWFGTGTTSVGLSSLDPATTYYWQVRAQNPGGTTYADGGDWWAFTTAATTASAPSGLQAEAHNSSVALSWLSPASVGGAAITDYLIRYRVKGAITWTPFADSVSATPSATVTGLVNGTSYQFRVAAVNSAGTGDWSARAEAKPATVPTAPRSVRGASGDARVALSWVAPAANGGSPLTDYQVQYRRQGTTTWTTFADPVSTARSATVTGLVNGATYQFRVAANNAMGRGAWSAGIKVKAGVPSAPRSPVSAAADQQVTIAWVAPATNGGSPLTDYLIRYRVKGTATWHTFADGVSTARRAHVIGLTNGVAYQFRVAAKNRWGVGPWSVVVQGRPMA